MNKESLLQLKSDVEIKFNEVEKQSDEAKLEMYRLQGEYRLLGKLIEELERSDNKEKKDASTK